MISAAMTTAAAITPDASLVLASLEIKTAA
jgi:hypothetical protein